MKFLIWLLVLAAAAVALSLGAHNPGYVLLVYAPYRIHLSLSLFALVLMGLFVLSFLSAQLLIHAVNLPEKVRRFRAERAEDKKRSVLFGALAAFLEGRFSEAEQAATQAMGLGETNEVLPIIAARAAHSHQEIERRDAFLAVVDDGSAMKRMAQAQFALDGRQPVAALEAVAGLRKIIGGDHAGVLLLELKAQQQIGDWDAVLDCVARLEKRHALDGARAELLRRQAWLEKLRSASGDAAHLMAVWKDMAVELHRDADIAGVAASAFGALGNSNLSWKIIHHALEVQWDSRLAGHLGDHPAADTEHQLAIAEHWLELHPRDPGLLLGLGKLCIYLQLAKKAGEYLELSRELAPDRAVHVALGGLAEQQGKLEEALAYYHRASVSDGRC